MIHNDNNNDDDNDNNNNNTRTKMQQLLRWPRNLAQSLSSLGYAFNTISLGNL